MYVTDEQELLLKVALLQGESALQAWQNWKICIDFEKELDAGSYRLLPLVYHQLRALGVDDPLMSRLKGIYRKEWYKNQMLFHTGAEVLRLFHSAGIDTLVLKGTALTLQYYKDYGLRPMSDFDVLVPIAQRRAAINLLMHTGWKPMLCPIELLTDDVLDAMHAWGFSDANQRQLDLHWHILHQCIQSDDDTDFWGGAISVQIGDISTKILSPMDQLLHICVHGLNWNPMPSFRWIADALQILKGVYSEDEWNHLVLQAENRRVTLPLSLALAYLRDSFDIAIPAYVLQKLNETPISNIERKYYSKVMVKPSLLGLLPTEWYSYLLKQEIKANISMIQRIIGFPRYLQRKKGMNSWQLLTWAFSRAIVNISQVKS